jgi:hypothetical protein
MDKSIIKNEILFKKETIGSHMNVCREIVTEDTELFNYLLDDFSNDHAVTVNTYFYSNMQDERILTCVYDSPTFFDWLFKRKRHANFKVTVKDCLLNPPKHNEPVIRIYETKKL